MAESSDAWRLTDFSLLVGAGPKEGCDNTVETGDLGVCEKEDNSGGARLFGLRKDDDGAEVEGVTEAILVEFKIVQAAAERFAHGKVLQKPVLKYCQVHSGDPILILQAYSLRMYVRGM